MHNKQWLYGSRVPCCFFLILHHKTEKVRNCELGVQQCPSFPGQNSKYGSFLACTVPKILYIHKHIVTNRVCEYKAMAWPHFSNPSLTPAQQTHRKRECNLIALINLNGNGSPLILIQYLDHGNHRCQRFGSWIV